MEKKFVGYKMTMSEREMLNEKHCRKCGKEIYVTPQWVYKDPFGYYCSWKCFNHRFDGVEVTKKGRKLKKVDQFTLDGEYIQTFDSAYDAMMEVDGLYTSLKTCIQLGKKYKGYLWKWAEEEVKDTPEQAKDENNLTEGQ